MLPVARRTLAPDPTATETGSGRGGADGHSDLPPPALLRARLQSWRDEWNEVQRTADDVLDRIAHFQRSRDAVWARLDSFVFAPADHGPPATANENAEAAHDSEPKLEL